MDGWMDSTAWRDAPIVIQIAARYVADVQSSAKVRHETRRVFEQVHRVRDPGDADVARRGRGLIGYISDVYENETIVSNVEL